MKPSSLQIMAENLGVSYIDINLSRVQEIGWISPQNNQIVSVEEAVLAKFSLDGWRGYSCEGGLILNLIKAMSFENLSQRNRATYIEAIYAQNVSFDEDRFVKTDLLNQVSVADIQSIERNFDIMASREVFTTQYSGFSSSSSVSMLDFFPKLEKWMFTELFQVAGNDLMHQIASKFSEDPYEYRRGWPDITMWKNGELRFVEVKAPRDKIRESQKKIITDFMKPLGLNYYLADVKNKV